MTLWERASALLQAHQLAEAADAFESILRDEPENGEAHYHASLALAPIGRYDDALAHAERAAELRPDWWRGHAQAGALRLALGQPMKALPYLQRAHALAPNLPDVLNNIGAAFRAAGGLREATDFFRRAVAADPRYIDAARNLASAYLEAGRADEAVATLEAILARGVVSAELFDSIGKALWKGDRIDESIVWFDKALALDPHNADALGHRGNAWMEQGKIAEGARSLREAIQADPNRGEFYRILIETDPSHITDADVAKLEQLASLPSNEKTAEVDYALSKVYDIRGEKERSFAHLVTANAFVRSKLPFDEATTLALFDRLTALFTPNLFTAKRDVSQSDRPIFIVGMPRSGTTLIEQVIASHPSVYGAGELALFTTTSDDVFAQYAVYPELAIATNDAVLLEIGERYLAGIAKLAPAEALRVTDKMPNNFLSVGLIALVFPNARIIHAMRNPLDTCISCFSISFESPQLVWTCDLTELGRYYKRYAKLMDHWRAVLPPERMLEVQYESMVDDLETQARRIIAYCGLPWDDRCLEFHKLQRPIKTASVSQVRKPIYRSSVNRAERYGELLAPLKQALA